MKLLLTLLLCLFAGTGMTHQGHVAPKAGGAARTELGTGAAFAPDGTLWVVHKRAVARAPWPEDAAAQSTRSLDQLVLRSSRDFGTTWSEPRELLPTPEPISADGENRPKIAFGANGVAVISWTSPTSPRFTGDIRLLRSKDGGTTWLPPKTVHADRQRITHRFESIAFDPNGRLFVAWIDRRDEVLAKAQGRAYPGAALYYAVSDDGGASFAGDYKVADHSCECCRIALAYSAADKAMLAFWRHVFPPNERDFMIAALGPDGAVRAERATHDRWAIDACPHHGGALSIGADGVQHRVWFNVVKGEGQTRYARIAVRDVRLSALPPGAVHADVLAIGGRVVLAWKAFDVTRTQLRAQISIDGGRSFAERTLARTTHANDQPRLIAFGDRVFVLWHTGESIAVYEVRP
jgi:hypothetical protein